jgi:gliding motility-associated-like protein
MDTTVCAGEIITLTASGRAEIVWYSFNDQTTPINTGYTFTTPHNTATTVYYIASDSAMCHSKLTEFTVNVEFCPIFIPNVFTPNGDGKNDVFTIDAKGFAGLHVRIYNRWGMLLYEYYTTDGGWNGETKSGSKCPDGVYFYIADMIDFYGKATTQAGDIELITK